MARQVFQSGSRIRGSLVRTAVIVPGLVLAGAIVVIIAAALTPSGSSLELPPFVSVALPTLSPTAQATERPSSSPQPTSPLAAGANATVASVPSTLGRAVVAGSASASSPTPAPTPTPTPTAAPPASPPAATAPTAQPTLPPAAPSAQPTSRGQAPSTFPGRTPPPH